MKELLEEDMYEKEEGDYQNQSDIKLPAVAVIAALQHGEDHDLPVASIHMPRGTSSDDEAEAEEGEVGEEASAE